MVGTIWEPVYTQIDLKRAVIILKDGGVGTDQQTLEVTIGQGNLTYTERRNIEYILDRGQLDDVREGDEVPVDVNMDFIWDYITGGSATGAIPTIEDVLKQEGAAADWVSTDADTCRPYAVDIEITYTPVPASCGDVEVITLQDFRHEELAHDLRAGTVAASGRCNVTKAQAVRSPQS